MINIKNLLIIVFLVFGVQTIALTEPSPKQVTIRSKFIAKSKKGGGVLSAPSITTLLGQSAQISITSPVTQLMSAILNGEEETKNVPIDEKEKLQDGIRLNLKVLETSNGLLIKGYAFVGIHNPEKLDRDVELLGLFKDNLIEPEIDDANKWAEEIQLSGTFRIRGKGYASLSTSNGNFWVEEGKFASGYKLVKLDLSKSQPSALIQKGEKQAWLGLRLGSSIGQLDMVKSFKDGGMLFVKEVESGDKFSLSMQRQNGEKLKVEMVATLN